jgi:indolepyruvate ferredoxin oxidoreductase, beta subunit
LNDFKTISILITALGGEGGGTLMNWIVECARRENLFVQGTSVPGVAQRTGSTSYYIEICDRNFEKEKEPVLSLYPKPGRVDIVIASELLETARVIERGYVNPDRTTLIASSSRVYTNLEKSHLADGRFDKKKILDACKKLSKNFICLDLNSIANDHSTIVSATMFGALAGSNSFPWKKNICEKIFQNNSFGKNSLAGFDYSYEQVKIITKNILKDDPNISLIKEHKININDDSLSSLPSATLSIINLGKERCIDYQNNKYSEIFMLRVKKLMSSIDREDTKILSIAENIIRRLSVWMTYEDIPRVAQLKIKPERFVKIKNEINLKNNQILSVQDIFKPGLNEIGAMLPRKIGSWFVKNKRIMKFLPFIGRGMKINSLTIIGFLTLKFLSSFRYVRPISLRYREEQKNIDLWLDNISLSINKSISFTEGLAEMPQLLKGYGDTWDRGIIKYNKINNFLVKKKLNNITEYDGKILKEAILISMNGSQTENLDIFISKNS